MIFNMFHNKEKEKRIPNNKAEKLKSNLNY